MFKINTDLHGSFFFFYMNGGGEMCEIHRPPRRTTCEMLVCRKRLCRCDTGPLHASIFCECWLEMTD